MHILIVPSEHFETSWSPLGAIFQRHQAMALKGAGHRVGLFSVGLAPVRVGRQAATMPERADRSGVPVIQRYRRTFIPGRIRSAQSVERRLLPDALEVYRHYEETEGRPDVLHAHNALFGGAVAAAIASRYGMPFVLTEHSSAFVRGLVVRGGEAAVRTIVERASRVTAVSKALAADLQRLPGYDAASQIDVLPNVVDPELDRGLTARYEPADSLRIVSLGSLDSNKNHASLLQAFSETHKGTSARLRIGGDGPLRETLETLAEELGIASQVEFLGLLAREQVANELTSADVLVSTSLYETFGVVLLEALSLGTPVITSNVGAAPELITATNGRVYPAGDHARLCAELRRFDPAGYDRPAIADWCRREYGADRFAATAGEIYASVIAQQEQAGR